ncbi:MAG: hypothetical protein ACI8W3_001752, partial [Myxococcota bacterium]
MSVEHVASVYRFAAFEQPGLVGGFPDSEASQSDERVGYDRTSQSPPCVFALRGVSDRIHHGSNETRLSTFSGWGESHRI